MSLPKLTEDMVKLNQELHDISSQALVEDRQVLANQTPVQTHEALKVQTSAKTLAETVASTPYTAAEKPMEQEMKEKEFQLKNGPAQMGDDRKQQAKKGKGAFEFPDGGWECSKCQNYNFKGRKECNRCKKVRTKQDLTGKPLHLLKTEQKDASAGLKLQRVKM